jgi:hypothetical protein
MTRYFYTDPLKAACMAKWFGMQFTTKNGTMGRCILPLLDAMREGDAWYIHPDSLPLLKIRVGDLVRMHGEFGRVDLVSHSLLKQFRKDPAAWRYIVQRDDKAYHWPESEEA